MRIVEIDEELSISDNAQKILCIRGDELVPGMVIRRIKTPFGIIDVDHCEVKEACFSKNSLSGGRILPGMKGIQ